MKSLGVVALALLCLGLFAFAVKNVLTTSREWQWEQDTTRYFTAVEVGRLIQDSTRPLKASLDSAVRVGHLAASRSRMRRDSLRGVAESLTVALRSSTNSLVSRQDALQAIETLEGSLGEARQESQALEAIIESQSQMLGVAKLENDRLWTLIDSASSVIRRVPRGCRIPVVGIKCPTVVVGGVVTRQGLDVGVAFGFPL